MKEQAKTAKSSGPTLSVYLPDETRNRLRALSERTGMTQTALAAEAISLHADMLIAFERIAVSDPQTEPTFRLFQLMQTLYFRHGAALPEALQQQFEALHRALGNHIAGEIAKVLTLGRARLEN